MIIRGHQSRLCYSRNVLEMLMIKLMLTKGSPMFAVINYIVWGSAILLSFQMQIKTAVAEDAQTPIELIRPLDQKDLAGFTKWLKKTNNKDPQKVFRLENGVLRCGAEDFGYVATLKPYKDYHLKVEYKWGEKNPNDKYVRNSGILLHGTGPDGSENGVWMTSIECQLAQGCEGDLILIKGKKQDGSQFPGTMASNTIVAEDGKTRWKTEGKKTPFSGKQFWWSKHQAFFKELIDTRGANDAASLLGEWTPVECICKGNRISIKVNGQTVNECYDVNPASGKILLQAEGFEIFFRNMEIRPLAN